MRGTKMSINRALSREMLFFGVDKAPLCLYGLIAVLMIYVTRFSFPYVLAGPLVFCFFHAIAVWGFKKDPKIVKVLANHFRYKGFYQSVSFARARVSAQKITSIPAV
ncbi:MAG: VirB3 family type IV secretion system protein [Gammaproteobacteria bacterium]|nr:VirB3 family type IV secretion system protein [Gammaproteobacteria bacterium]